MKRYKSVISKNEIKLNESKWSDANLSRFFFSGEYDNYQHGNPKKAAQQIYDLTVNYLDNIEKNLELAGSFLAPAIKDELEKMLKKNFSRIKIK
jgi:hypothetical protein